MSSMSAQLVATPILVWLVLLTLAVVGYLARLQFIQWRRNRRFEEKRAELDQRPPLPPHPRPLAIRRAAKTLSIEDECLTLRRRLQKVDRHRFPTIRPFELN